MPDATIVHFFWTPPSSNVTICGYNLTCTPMVLGLDDLTMTYTVAKTHIYTLMGFRPATEYRCRVLAFNSAGYGPPTEINITTIDESKICISLR
ncbi:fibronectin type III domain-containing protein, partial [Salmonella enterica subsp. enterica serovar Kentucky]|uniref:fibronectin type III domain-containing protein n=1 Tax=Salmonella enterica TaxID=28901 RepID=UPI003F4B87E8